MTVPPSVALDRAIEGVVGVARPVAQGIDVRRDVSFGVVDRRRHAIEGIGHGRDHWSWWSAQRTLHLWVSGNGWADDARRSGGLAESSRSTNRQ